MICPGHKTEGGETGVWTQVIGLRSWVDALDHFIISPTNLQDSCKLSISATFPIT